MVMFSSARITVTSSSICCQRASLTMPRRRGVMVAVLTSYQILSRAFFAVLTKICSVFPFCIILMVLLVRGFTNALPVEVHGVSVLRYCQCYRPFVPYGHCKAY